ncbi:MAG: DUF1289 domain-containing protein [Rhodospirillaceae bacterium]|nr:DUF1289 domain-containing protein [Rhodospirillaceae bacterium]
MSTLSPCISVCRIDRVTGYCEGCGRTMTEIAEWLHYDPDRKRAIIAELEHRPRPARAGRKRK